MKSKQIHEAHGLYLCGLSLSQVAIRFDVTRQSLHYYFKSIGLKSRPLIRSQQKRYNGDNYTINNMGYWRKTQGDRELMHRQIWVDKNGPIPKGMQIHHIDEDKNNNVMDNFKMMSISDHSKLHGFVNNQYTKRWPDKYDYDGIACNQCGLKVFVGENTHVRRRKFCSMKCKGGYAKIHGRSKKCEIIKVWKKERLGRPDV